MRQLLPLRSVWSSLETDEKWAATAGVLGVRGSGLGKAAVRFLLDSPAQWQPMGSVWIP